MGAAHSAHSLVNSTRLYMVHRIIFEHNAALAAFGKMNSINSVISRLLNFAGLVAIGKKAVSFQGGQKFNFSAERVQIRLFSTRSWVKLLTVTQSRLP